MRSIVFYSPNPVLWIHHEFEGVLVSYLYIIFSPVVRGFPAYCTPVHAYSQTVKATRVNSPLNDTGDVHVENFILPKSLHLCMIRYEGDSSIAREEDELLHEVLDMKTIYGRVMEEDNPRMSGGRRQETAPAALLAFTGCQPGAALTQQHCWPGRAALPATPRGTAGLCRRHFQPGSANHIGRTLFGSVCIRSWSNF
jgi:hypothetical protein